MGRHVLRNEVMTFDEFAAFVADAPAGEKWELIDGIAVMSPSAAHRHQLIVANILGLLWNARVAGAPWVATPGINIRLEGRPASAPQPDVIVTASLGGTWFTTEPLATFEVLSPSTRGYDLVWKRRTYTSLPTLQHYVVLSPDEPWGMVLDRANGFRERTVEGRDGVLSLAGLAVDLPMGEIYRGLD